MTTDTIPAEAIKAVSEICSKVKEWNSELINPGDTPHTIVSQACLAYHKCHSQELEKQCDDLRTRAERLEGERETWKKCFLAVDEDRCKERARAEKAEAEVAELKKSLNPANDPEMKWDDDLGWLHEGQLSQFKELQSELTQLQQDVRPLVEALNSYATCSYPMVIYPATYPAKKALETFLAKHPELKT